MSEHWGAARLVEAVRIVGLNVGRITIALNSRALLPSLDLNACEQRDGKWERARPGRIT